MKLHGALIFCAICLSLASAQKLRETKFPFRFKPKKSLLENIELYDGFAVAQLPADKKQKLSAYYDTELAAEAAPLLT